MGVRAFESNHYHAVLIDNDFGEGIITLAKLVNDFGAGVPIAYVSAYDIPGLIMQNEQLLQRSEEPFIHPRDFARLGITHVRKRGNNISKELCVEDLRKGLAEFLRSASS
jgi:hypothetical protein